MNTVNNGKYGQQGPPSPCALRASVLGLAEVEEVAVEEVHVSARRGKPTGKTPPGLSARAMARKSMAKKLPPVPGPTSDFAGSPPS